MGHGAAVVFAVAPRVFEARLLAGRGVGLAWQAGNDEIHLASPGLAVEVGHIAAPNRARLQGRFFHTLFEHGRGVTFPLSDKRRLGSESEEFESGMDSLVEHADSGAKTSDSDAGIIHIPPPFPPCGEFPRSALRVRFSA